MGYSYTLVAFLKQNLPAAVIDTQLFPEYVHDITPVRSGLMSQGFFGSVSAEYERIGVDYFCQLVVIKTVAGSIFSQYEAHHIGLTVQLKLVRKDMRHEAGLFLCGSDMNAAFYDLRDKRYGTGQKFVKAMR